MSFLVDASTINAVAAVTLNKSQSGTTFICTKLGSGTSTVTLPNPTIAGIKYTFILAQAAVVAHLLTIASPVADTMSGIWLGGTPTVNETANPCTTTNANFTATAQWSDKWELISDGAYWRAYGTTGAAAGMSFT